MRLWAFMLWLVVVIAACGVPSTPSATTTATPGLRLTATEVVQLFLEWACPADTRRATGLYQPKAKPSTTSSDAWLIETQHGTFTVRDSTRIVVPLSDAADFAAGLRASTGCR